MKKYTLTLLALCLGACTPADVVLPEVDAGIVTTDAAELPTEELCCCTESMDLPRQIPGADSRVQRTPFDPADPKSPARASVYGRPSTATRALVYNEDLDGLTFEQINLIEEWGLTRDFHADQLAQACEQGVWLTALQMPAIRNVLAVDMQLQAGSYARIGQVVIAKVRHRWANTVPGTDGANIEVELPFEVSSASIDGQTQGTVYLPNSEFQGQNGAIGTQYNLSVFPSDTAARVFSVGVVGTATTSMLVGDGDGEGFRSVAGMLVYRTTGVRNPDWPFVKVTTLIAPAFTPLSPTSAVAGPVEINAIYDAAVAFDTVELLKDGISLVPAVTQVVTDVPRGRMTFEITDTVQFGPADYSVLFKGVESNSFTVDT